MRNITVEHFKRTSVEDQEVEMVERKGIGHPDTICDALAEEVSKELSKEYKKRYGSVLHHNVDKIALAAGHSSPKFEGGEVLKPIRIFLIGRASNEYKGEEIPVDKIAIRVCRDYLQGTLFHLKPEHIEIDSYLSQGSGDLVHCFERAKEVIPTANDTSFGIGHAPYSRLEWMVLKSAEMLNSEEYRKANPSVGEDVKVMGLREANEFHLTVCIAFIDKYIKNPEDYLNAKKKAESDIAVLCSKLSEESDFGNKPNSLSVFVNMADNPEDPGSFYITVTGLSAEMGDDGMVGRGNRSNGLITPNRPMSLEAACGKNPVNHVGKIYNVMADDLSRKIYEKVPGVSEVYVDILSSIGQPIDQPKRASIKIIPKENANFAEIKEKAFEIADSEFANILKVSERLINGDLRTY